MPGKKDEPEFGLLTYLDGLMDDLHDNVPKALKHFDVDGVHDARVATRRLKAAMGLLEPVLTAQHRKDFEKVLKKIRRRLGRLRDLDVMIEHVGKLESHPTHGPAAAWLRAHMEKDRDCARSDSRDGPGSADFLARLGCWWHVREEIAEAQEAIDSLLAESLHLQLDAFAEQAQGILAQTLHPAQAREKQDPHQLRISGKLLRYTLEIAQAQEHELPAAVTKQFKQMQELLGNWHDDVVLVQCAMQTSLDVMLAYHDLPMQEKLMELNRFFLKRANKDLTEFSRLWQKRGDEVSQTIRDRFRLSTPTPALTAGQTRVAASAPVFPSPGTPGEGREGVTELKTGPGPAGSGEPPAPAEPTQDAASTA